MSVSSAISGFYAYKFIKLLTQKWTDTDAYKAGFLDEKGVSTKKNPSTSEEKEIYSRFNRLVFNIKRMLEKLPFMKSTIGRYTAALALLKEEYGIENIDELFLEHIVENSSFLNDIESCKIDEDSYMMFGKWFQNDMLIENFTGGFDGISPPLFSKKKNEINEEPDDSFAGISVFDCDMETFNNCRLGKKKFARYKTYVGNDEIGEKIRNYSLKNPKKSVILRNSNTGAMLYLRNNIKT